MYTQMSTTSKGKHVKHLFQNLSFSAGKDFLMLIFPPITAKRKSECIYLKQKELEGKWLHKFKLAPTALIPKLKLLKLINTE